MNVNFQKLVSDYISRHRNARGSLRRIIRQFLQKFFYISPEKRLAATFSLKKAGQLDKYYTALRDVGIEFARKGWGGDAVKIAAALPPEYINAHFANTLKIVQNVEARNMSFLIEPTTACNLRCPLCTHRAWGLNAHKENKMMPLDTFKQIYDKVVGHAGKVCLGGGGESFLNPHLYDMIDYISPIPVTLQTNGVAPMNVERLVGCNVESVLFSIDGVDQRTYGKYRIGGSYEKAIGNLKKLVEARKRAKVDRPRVIFQYLLFKHNEMYVNQARKIAKDLGADSFDIGMGIVMRGLKTDFETDLRRFTAIGANAWPYATHFELDSQRVARNNSPYCSAPSWTPYIDLNGLVWPCCACGAEDNLFKTPLSIFDHSFEEIYNSPDYVKFRKAALNNRMAVAPCDRCYNVSLPSLRKQLENTELAYPPPIALQGRVLAYNELEIDEEYADELRAQGLFDELRYFQESGRYQRATGK